MVFGANRFHFVALKPDIMDMVAPELAKRESDVSRLQAAIESSALFYTAMRSEGVAASDVIGAELADAESGLSSEKTSDDLSGAVTGSFPEFQVHKKGRSRLFFR